VHGVAATMEMSRMVAVAAATSGSQYEFEPSRPSSWGARPSRAAGDGSSHDRGFIILGIVNNMMIMLNISPISQAL